MNRDEVRALSAGDVCLSRDGRGRVDIVETIGSDKIVNYSYALDEPNKMARSRRTLREDDSLWLALTDVGRASNRELLALELMPVGSRWIGGAVNRDGSEAAERRFFEVTRIDPLGAVTAKVGTPGAVGSSFGSWHPRELILAHGRYVRVWTEAEIAEVQKQLQPDAAVKAAVKQKYFAPVTRTPAPPRRRPKSVKEAELTQLYGGVPRPFSVVLDRIKLPDGRVIEGKDWTGEVSEAVLIGTITSAGTAPAVGSVRPNERKRKMKAYAIKFENGEFGVYKTKATADVIDVEDGDRGPLRVELPNNFFEGEADELTLADYDNGYGVVDKAFNAAIRVAKRKGGDAPVPRKTRIKNQAYALGQAAALGAGLAAMNKVGDELLAFAAKLAPRMPWITPMLEDPMGRECVKLLLAILIHTAATQTDAVPKGATVARVCEWQVTMSTMRVVAPQLDLLADLIKSLVESGEKLPALEGGVANILNATSHVEDAEVVNIPRGAVARS